MKGIGRFVLLLTAVVILVSALPSCGSFGKQQFTKYSFDAFDTVTTVVGYEASEDEFEKKAKIILDGLYEYHKLFDIYNTYEGVNNLATVNSKAGDGEWVKVDRKIIDLLIFSKDMYALTEGEVNVAFGAVLKLWHDKREAASENPDLASLPDPDELRAAAEHTAPECIEIDEAASAVRISDARASLDVGAIAKGYATERVARALEEGGVTGYLLNVGGNVRAVGAKPSGAPWRVGIENPFEGTGP